MLFGISAKRDRMQCRFWLKHCLDLGFLLLDRQLIVQSIGQLDRSAIPR